MLVLQRKKGDSIVIGGETVVSISEIGADWVKLAIDAPSRVKVLRSELLKAAQEANREAIETPIADMKSFLENRREKKDE